MIGVTNLPKRGQELESMTAKTECEWKMISRDDSEDLPAARAYKQRV